MAEGDVCHIFIPFIIIGPSEATLEDPGTKRTMRITFSKQSELIINGQATIRMEPKSKTICVVFAIRNANKN
jgi:hypothetical protein